MQYFQEIHFQIKDLNKHTLSKTNPWENKNSFDLGARGAIASRKKKTICQKPSKIAKYSLHSEEKNCSYTTKKVL